MSVFSEAPGSSEVCLKLTVRMMIKGKWNRAMPKESPLAGRDRRIRSQWKSKRKKTLRETLQEVFQQPVISKTGPFLSNYINPPCVDEVHLCVPVLNVSWRPLMMHTMKPWPHSRRHLQSICWVSRHCCIQWDRPRGSVVRKRLSLWRSWPWKYSLQILKPFHCCHHQQSQNIPLSLIRSGLLSWFYRWQN